jgi:hypothetical protein
MQFNDLWRIESHPTDAGKAGIMPYNGVFLAAPDHWMPRHVAEQIVEVHNRNADAKAIAVFRDKIGKSITEALQDVLDTDDKKTTENYWHLIPIMTESAVAILEAASQRHYTLVETKADGAF